VPLAYIGRRATLRVVPRVRFAELGAVMIK
jgi:hypothetical protein